MDLEPWVGAVSFGSLTVGFGTQALAAIQFRTGHLPLRVMGPIIVVVAFAVVSAIPFRL